MKLNHIFKFLLGIVRHPRETGMRLRELKRIAAEPSITSTIPMNKMVNITIVPVTNDSSLQNQIVAMYAQNPSPYVHGPNTMEKLHDYISRGIRYFLFANDDGDYVCARAYDPNTNLLQNAITDFNHRGKGYQVAAGHAVMTLLADEGLDEVGTTVMKSNTRMQRIMIARGWKMTPDAQNSDLIRGILRLDGMRTRRCA